GVKLDPSPEQVARCIDEAGIGFMFARSFHSSMRHVGGPRQELGIRTIFNILGPLSNPAAAEGYVLGVFAKELTGIMARVLGDLGAKRAFVVHGDDGQDEITTTTTTHVSELIDGEVKDYSLDPSDLGFEKCTLADLAGGDAAENAETITSILARAQGPKTDIVILNAAAAIVASGVTDDLKAGIDAARESVSSDAAKAKLAALVELSNS
ncbi:anthranilate phosphoribosyltransferase, partial [Candidatus Hydrogenedentota bacterium]